MSFASDQINCWGWRRMKQLAGDKGVDLVAIFLPTRQQYMAEMVHPKARLQFLEYMDQFDHQVILSSIT